MAIRPRTLPAAAAGVVTGSALAYHDSAFHPLIALAALIVGLCLQTGSNLANDLFDFERGVDAQREHGPQRVTQSGLLTPAEVKRGTIIVFAVAALLGLLLAFRAGWVVLVVGGISILSALAYSAGPFPLGEHGLGDVFVFLFFGMVSVAGTYFVQARTVSSAAWEMSLPIGLIIVGILVVNNLRDIETDRAAGKFTLPARFGIRFAKSEYLFCLIIAYLCLPVFVALRVVPIGVLLVWLSLPFAWHTANTVLTRAGKSLNSALAGTGQLVFLYSALFFLGMLLTLN
jgi:1,4-dihydroxy-2-naphthoate octaprenyltransferase